MLVVDQKSRRKSIYGGKNMCERMNWDRLSVKRRFGVSEANNNENENGKLIKR